MAEFTTGGASGGGLWGELIAGMDREYAGRARFAIVDMGVCRDITARHAIKSVPALLAFEGGVCKGYIPVADTKAEIWRWIARALDVQPSCGVVLSVHPEYAAAIAAGTKRVEFRRNRMHAPVSSAIFYATSPEKRLICLCEAFWVDWADLDVLWERWGR